MKSSPHPHLHRQASCLILIILLLILSLTVTSAAPVAEQDSFTDVGHSLRAALLKILRERHKLHRTETGGLRAEQTGRPGTGKMALPGAGTRAGAETGTGTGTGTREKGWSLPPVSDSLTDFVRTVSEAERSLIESYRSNLNRLEKAVALSRGKFRPNPQLPGGAVVGVARGPGGKLSQATWRALLYTDVPAQVMPAQKPVQATKILAHVTKLSAQATKMSAQATNPVMVVQPSGDESISPAAANYGEVTHRSESALSQVSLSTTSSEMPANYQLPANFQLPVNSQLPASSQLPVNSRLHSHSQIPAHFQLPVNSHLPANSELSANSPTLESVQAPMAMSMMSHIPVRSQVTIEVDGPINSQVTATPETPAKSQTPANSKSTATLHTPAKSQVPTGIPGGPSVEWLQPFSRVEPEKSYINEVARHGDVPTRIANEFERYEEDMESQREHLEARLRALLQTLQEKKIQKKATGFGDFIPLAEIPRHYAQQVWGNVPVADEDLGIVSENAHAPAQRMATEVLAEGDPNFRLRELLKRLRQEMQLG